MYFLYIIKSYKKNRYYIGSSSDPAKRLAEHNNGYTKSTKPYRPWEIIYTESFRTKQEACKKEWYLKHPPGYLEKRRIIEQYSVNNGGVA